MRISLLLEREPFGSILEKTLSGFWSDRFGSTYAVRWHDGGDRRDGRRESGHQRWLLNSRLNAIFVSGADAGVFEPVRLEYARALNPLVRPLQWAYVQAASRGRTAAWLASPAMDVSPEVPDAERLLVLGGNSRIRVLDRHAGTAHVVTKDGFDATTVARELEVRKLVDAAPEVLDVEPDGRWYSEEYVVGAPLNRLALQQRASEGLAVAVAALQDLHERTVEAVDASVYAEGLVRRLTLLMKSHPWLDEEARTHLSQQVQRARTVLRQDARDDGFATVQSHGDFQPANILVGDARTWLIDWEHTGRRQRAYDPLVFALRSRFPEGLAGRVGAALETGRDAHLLEAWPGLRWGEVSARVQALAVFLLEELDFSLTEAANPRFYGPTPDLGTLRRELPEALAALERVA